MPGLEKEMWLSVVDDEDDVGAEEELEVEQRARAPLVHSARHAPA